MKYSVIHSKELFMINMAINNSSRDYFMRDSSKEGIDSETILIKYLKSSFKIIIHLLKLLTTKLRKEAVCLVQLMEDLTIKVKINLKI